MLPSAVDTRLLIPLTLVSRLEMSPSAVVTLVVMLDTSCSIAEMSPSAVVTRVFRPFTEVVSVVILPSAEDTRVVRLVAVCSKVEISPSAVDTRVLIPLTSDLRVVILPSLVSTRASKLSWERVKDEMFVSFCVTRNAMLVAVCSSSDTFDSISRIFSSTTPRSLSTVSTRSVTKVTVLVSPSRLLCIVLDFVVSVEMLLRSVSVPFCSFQAEPL